MLTLGIWDNHDSGVAVIENNKILFAINEERLSRRKLEILFPHNSIRYAMTYLGLGASDIDHIAISTFDVAKTIQRFFPFLKEEYYMIRRRKKVPSKLNMFKKFNKYWITQIPGNSISRSFSDFILKRELSKHGLDRINRSFVEHHLCHAACAAFTSEFDSCLVVTMDGLGDGLSATISVFKNGTLTRIKSISAKSSLGIFFEHVTNLLNMRELEDEGKVMALANYAYSVNDIDNPLIDFFEINDLEILSKYSSLRLHKRLSEILWTAPSEQFAAMAQRALEVWVIELIQNALAKTSESNIALAGGLFSNIKVNRLIKNLEKVNNCYVFPHMGDGGLAMGAALWVMHEKERETRFDLSTVQIGPEFSSNEIENLLLNSRLRYHCPDDLLEQVSDLLKTNHVIQWFQGRSEFGPRALGGRSILARPDSMQIRQKLNLFLKKRVWYQPFCPSILEEDAIDVFEDCKGFPNRFMTMGYMVKPEHRGRLAGVINIDGSCRPQILSDTPTIYVDLLKKMKEKIGIGALLNTSFNLHGEPMVNSPEDAIRTFRIMKPDALVIDKYLIINEKNN
ncbi:hypothetical protein JW824_00170 [bacterium]|nr:hypothetical protein [bacterium]